MSRESARDAGFSLLEALAAVAVSAAVLSGLGAMRRADCREA